MKKNKVLKTNSHNCVNCKYLKYIYEKSITITEMEAKYPDMDHYSSNYAYKCTSNMIVDEDIRKQIILYFYAGKRIACKCHS